MKLKSPTALLTLTTLLFGLTACTLFMQIDRSKKTIANRELTIISYMKVIDAMGRSNAISSQQLKASLLEGFNLGEMGYNDYSDEYYIVAHPIDREINPSQLGDFMGLQLVFDSQKTLKSIRLYKP
jgi:hypothetical protein